MATRKDVRELKVCEVSGYRYQAVPQIQLKGAWLRQYGFSEETPVTVKCSDGQIVITPRRLKKIQSRRRLWLQSRRTSTEGPQRDNQKNIDRQ